jgi:cob(I)alamin adenosyltransferase
MSKPHLGKIHVYTGDGHGKTTTALGVALRAIGHDYKVVVIQFMKGKRDIGEVAVQEKLSPNLEVYQFGREAYVDKRSPDPADIEMAGKGLEFAKKVLLEGEPDILILDEINMAVDFNLLKLKEVIKFLDKVPGRGTEIILTGRNAKKGLIERADLVTEMKKVKHYYDLGLQARRGIEY